MSRIIPFEKRRPQANSSIIKKMIDGEIVEYLDFDMLSTDQQVQLLNSNSRRRRSNDRGAADSRSD